MYVAAYKEINRLEIIQASYAKARIVSMKSIAKIAENAILNQLSYDIHIDTMDADSSYIDMIRKRDDWLPVHVCNMFGPYKWLAINVTTGIVVNITSADFKV
jgi:hypothetical protein